MIHLTVVNYRTPEDLDRFLQSFRKFPPTITPWSLAIVNVAPGRDDMAVGERWADVLGASHYWNPENIGYGRGCNEGACCAKWPDNDEGVLAFFNADVILTRAALDRCTAGLMSNSAWGVLGPRQVNHLGRFTHAGVFGTLDKPQHRGWFEHSRDGKYTDVRDDAVTVSGAAYFMRRTVWDTLRTCPIYREIAPEAKGAFLPTPHYYEETWASYHAQAHGVRVVYWGRDTITHLWHQASPVGGHADKLMPVSREIFRAACDRHGIAHD